MEIKKVCPKLERKASKAPAPSQARLFRIKSKKCIILIPAHVDVLDINPKKEQKNMNPNGNIFFSGQNNIDYKPAVLHCIIDELQKIRLEI